MEWLKDLEDQVARATKKEDPPAETPVGTPVEPPVEPEATPSPSSAATTVDPVGKPFVVLAWLHHCTNPRSFCCRMRRPR